MTTDPIRSFWSRAFLLFWLMLAGLLSYLYYTVENISFLFPLFIAFFILIALANRLRAHDADQVRRWEIAALLAVGPLPFFLRGTLYKTELYTIVASFAAAATVVAVNQKFFVRLKSTAQRVREEISFLQKKMDSVRQENSFYSVRNDNLKLQIGARQKLSSFAREIGTLLEPEKIKERLLGKIGELFPEEQIAFRTSANPADAADLWVAERKMSLLSKDIVADNRFTLKPNGQETRSLLATPLHINRSLLGLIRVESSVPNRFSETDLQQLELYAHLAILALENAQLFAKVNAMAARDALTGLATHRIFQEKMAEEILRAARYHTPLSVMMIDVDHFKLVNDRYGHLAGDQVLREVSEILLAYCREVDTAARYGGEEFALIFPQLDLEETAGLAESIRQQISDHSVTAPQQDFNISVSIGCASFPQDAQISSQLIRKADERLYKAKSTGRNRVIVN